MFFSTLIHQATFLSSAAVSTCLGDIRIYGYIEKKAHIREGENEYDNDVDGIFQD